MPVVPVGIQGTYNIFEKQQPRIKSSKVIVTFGKPIYTDQLDRAGQKQLPSIVKEQVRILSNQ